MKQKEKINELEIKSKTFSLDKEHFIIAGIFGKNEELGEGKTLLLTYIAQKQHLKGEKIYSNYSLPFSHEFTNIGMLTKIKNCFLALDDIIPLMESRQSQMHVLTTWILNTCRKRGIKLVYTAQIQSAVEYRLRKISQIVIQTSYIDFPRFHVEIFNTRGKKIDEFQITYKSDILSLYSTLEIVYQKIPLKQLIGLVEKIGRKRNFQTITRAKFAFSYDLAGTIFDLIGSEMFDVLEETLEGYGFKLT